MLFQIQQDFHSSLNFFLYAHNFRPFIEGHKFNPYGLIHIRIYFFWKLKHVSKFNALTFALLLTIWDMCYICNLINVYVKKCLN